MRLQLQTVQLWLRRHLTKNPKAVNEQIRLSKKGTSRQRKRMQRPEQKWPAKVKDKQRGQCNWSTVGEKEREEGRAIAAIGHADTCRKHVASLLSLPLSAITWEEITADSP